MASPVLQTLRRALAFWAVLMLAESVHGALRRLTVGIAEPLVLRQVAVGVGAAIIFALTWAGWSRLRVRSSREALAIGLLWVLLTVGFEFSIGWALGAGWDRMVSDYDLAHGGLMPLGLLCMALTPWTVRQLRGVRRPAV